MLGKTEAQGIFFVRLIQSCMFAMIVGERESLNYKLAGKKDYETLAKEGAQSKHDDDNLGSWGHEFVRSLAGEIGQEYNSRVIAGADPDLDDPFKDLLQMVEVIVPFHVTHNAEAEAVDLLIEVQRLKNLLQLDSIDDNNYQRICLYLIKTADYMSDPDDLQVRKDHVANLFESKSYIITICFSVDNRKCWKQPTKFLGSKNTTSTHCV